MGEEWDKGGECMGEGQWIQGEWGIGEQDSGIRVRR